ncbi:glycosyltransferase family 4 protein [Agromyces atrinae]|uniref:Glycosyltransferase involved in cell wall biosynthesis n=1 Tax=Agromyces atrinae TaxID=592376 RepID=A0A852SL17_9MICO|nr:glycosyltransferase family 4 protein [Agromyces atrinae]NYD68409.1 glycosyltransferase involved in cell wall biosynthesis [Agromyces atrinae]
MPAIPTTPNDRAPNRRRRVFLSAYACGPVEEPEASAGWAFATAAAEHDDVWVVTRRRFEPAVTAALAADPELASHLTVIHIDLSDRVRAWWKHSWDLYWYYALWQRKLLRTVTRLHAELHFDLVHHVTFANDWMPCGLSRLPDVPFVWGPIGGATKMPYWKLRRWLGTRGLVYELIRDLVTRVPRRIFGDPAARRASLVIAQNQDVADRFRRAERVIVEPNAALDLAAMPEPEPRSTGPTPTKRAVYVGRLIPLKGVPLAISAIARETSTEWTLDIYGSGPQRELLESLAAELGVTARIRFLGHRPRAEVLRALAEADAMLFPSMHDQAGWAAAEASTLGCPVVCLPLGGPPLLAEPNAFVASIDGDIVGNLAEQLRLAGERGGVPHDRWGAGRLTRLVDEWYSDVLQLEVAR